MKKFLFSAFILLSVFLSQSAFADSISGYVTGDDQTWVWGYNPNTQTFGGSGWSQISTNYQAPVNITGSVGQSQELYFAVMNNYYAPSPNYSIVNPGGLLASFTDNTGTFGATGTNTLLSNTNTFQVLAVNPWLSNPTQNPATLTYGTATSYGPNNGTAYPWPALNSIDPNAQWLWTANNDPNNYAATDNYTIWGVNLGSTPVATPEPSTVVLFALAAGMILFFMRRKMVKLA